MPYLALMYIMTVLSITLPRRTGLFLGMLTIFMYSSTRFNVGVDYFTYYQRIIRGDIERFEPIPRIIMNISNIFGPQLFFIISSLVITICYAMIFRFAARISAFSPIGILAFASLPVGFIDSLSYVRQFMAIALFLLAFIERRNAALSLTLAVSALFFHTATLLFLPLLALSHLLKIRLPRIAYVLLFLPSFAIAPVLQLASEATGLYSSYFEHTYIAYGQRIHLLFLGLGIYLLFRLDFLAHARWEFNLFFAGLWMYTALMPFGAVIARAGWFGMAICPVLLGWVLAKERVPIRAITVLCMLAIFFIQVYLASVNPDWNWLTNSQPFFMLNTLEKLDFVNDFVNATGRRG